MIVVTWYKFSLYQTAWNRYWRMTTCSCYTVVRKTANKIKNNLQRQKKDRNRIRRGIRPWVKHRHHIVMTLLEAFCASRSSRKRERSMLLEHCRQRDLRQWRIVVSVLWLRARRQLAWRQWPMVSTDGHSGISIFSGVFRVWRKWQLSISRLRFRDISQRARRWRSSIRLIFRRIIHF